MRPDTAGPNFDQWLARRIMGWEMRPVAGEGTTWIKPDGEVVKAVPAFSTDRDAAQHVVTYVKALGYEFTASRNPYVTCKKAVEALASPPRLRPRRPRKRTDA